MNYLAHSFLSFSEGQLVGNIIADFVRNADRHLYPEEIQQGIRLHREIDTHTDAHPVVSEAKKIFQPYVRLYSGAFVDVAFDHFLAKELAQDQLRRHADHVYSVLNSATVPLPEPAKQMIVRMAQQDWLFSYRSADQIKYPMANVLHKAKYLSGEEPVHAVFLQNYQRLENHFRAFFPELEAFITTKYAR